MPRVREPGKFRAGNLRGKPLRVMNGRDHVVAFSRHKHDGSGNFGIAFRQRGQVAPCRRVLVQKRARHRRRTLPEGKGLFRVLGGNRGREERGLQIVGKQAAFQDSKVQRGEGGKASGENGRRRAGAAADCLRATSRD